MDPFIHGTLWSLFVNIVLFVGGSFLRKPLPAETLQANVFVPAEFAPSPSLRYWRTSVTAGDLQATVARYLGEERTARSFRRFASERGIELDPKTWRTPTCCAFPSSFWQVPLARPRRALC